LEEYNTLPTEKNPSGPIAFTSRMKFLHDWQAHYGRPIHLGEFGAYTKGDQQSRANYYSALRYAAEAQGIGWCIWDWNSGFRYWDEKTQQPLPGMREALFGK
jgi:aryl-phospho-beta-D-glucosidase BglC (GH1 family)